MNTADPHAWLRHLQVTRLFATWQPDRPWSPPPALTNTLRGAVGASVMDVGCVRPSRECAGCESLEGCPVATWYDPNRYSGSRLRPYVIRVHQGVDRVTPDLPLVAEWLLTGRTPHAHLLVEAMLRAGRLGLGPDRIPHRLLRLDAWGDGAQVRLIDSGRAIGLLPRPGALLRHVHLPDAPARAEVELLTPVQAPAWVGEPHPRALLQLGVNRLRDLARDAGAPLERWWDLDRVEARWEELRHIQHGRWSQRQSARVDLSGWLGRFRLTGDVTAVADLLAAMEVLHVGRNTSVGMGRLGVRWG
jgi:hypothetical protein